MAKFYRPDELPNEEESTTPNALEPVKAMEIRRLHEYYNHPSVNEMKCMAHKWFGDLEVHQLWPCRRTSRPEVSS